MTATNSNDVIAETAYAELKQLAAAYMRRERAAHTLQASALVNEAYLRLADQGVQAESRAAFVGIAARLMRQILVDHARARNAKKRQADRMRMTLADDVLGQADPQDLDVLDLHASLDELAEHDARKARVVELRFFGGLTVKEVAEVLGVSNTTAEDDWYMARAWLKRKLRVR